MREKVPSLLAIEREVPDLLVSEGEHTNSTGNQPRRQQLCCLLRKKVPTLLVHRDKAPTLLVIEREGTNSTGTRRRIQQLCWDPRQDPPYHGQTRYYCKWDHIEFHKASKRLLVLQLPTALWPFFSREPSLALTCITLQHTSFPAWQNTDLLHSLPLIPLSSRDLRVKPNTF